MSENESDDEPKPIEAMYELHRTIATVWSDLIIKYYMGDQLEKGLILSADSKTSCRDRTKLDGMGCNLLNVSCIDGKGFEEGAVPTCTMNFEKACLCPEVIPHWARKWLKLPPLYNCDGVVTSPARILTILKRKGYDLESDLSSFKDDFHLSELEFQNPLLIRPENYLWPRYHISMFDLLGLSATNPAVLDVQIPVGQCTLNSYFPIYCVLGFTVVGFLVYYPVRFWGISRRSRKRHAD